jgi:predicted nucleic acid-binding protein
VTAYDAAFLALAEFLDSPLVTLDRRLARAAGHRCRLVVPPVQEFPTSDPSG